VDEPTLRNRKLGGLVKIGIAFSEFQIKTKACACQTKGNTLWHLSARGSMISLRIFATHKTGGVEKKRIYLIHKQTLSHACVD
jgi:hypothetical protein